jgi:hypothetical protein
MESLALIPKISKSVVAVGDRKKFLATLNAIARGMYASELVAAKLFSANDISFIAARDPIAKKLLSEARKEGNVSRQILREDAADKRAIEGVKEPVFSVKGAHVGDRTVYSDNLLIAMLKANDPEKYSPPPAGAFAGSGVVLSVNLGIVRDPPRTQEPASAKAIDVEVEEIETKEGPQGEEKSQAAV